MGPSRLNRNEFQRSVTYQRAENIPKDYGVNTAKCVLDYRHLFTLKPINDTTQLAIYQGFDDLIPHIVGCNDGYEYVQKYPDLPYQLEIPLYIHKWSFGFGNKSFYISLNSEDDDTSKTTIVIYYDFDNEMKNYFLSQIKEEKKKADVVRRNDLSIYETLNWEGKYEGDVFFDKSIVIAYYTKNEQLVNTLQKCVTSFKYIK